MAFFKGLIPGVVLTWVISIILGSNGSRGGFLSIARENVGGVEFFWSWPLFIVATGIAWAIFAMME